MIISGFTISVRRTGTKLAIATAPTNTSGAASHTHKAGELLPNVIPLSHRDKRSDPRIPAAMPAKATPSFCHHLTDYAPALRSEGDTNR
jgi:hypothetical protein